MSASPATVVLQLPTFDEEFDMFSASENGQTGTWMTEYPYWGSEHTFSGSHEAEYYSGPNTGVDPFSLKNGVLSITGSSASITGSNPLGLPYNSGLITTYKSFAQLYGYFEVRAELPAGQGLWPAFWLASVSQQTPAELDVFEVLGDHPNVLYATAQDRTGSGGGSSTAINVADTSAAFHTYGVDWELQTTTFYMDDTVIARVATPTSMNVPMFMLLNLAIGAAGSWPGAPSPSTVFPASMQIDYVRAYATSGTVGATDPAPFTSPAILPALQASQPGGQSWLSVTIQHYGNQDAGSPQAGIGIALLNASGKVVATSVSDGNGHVGFTNLAAGNYSVQYLVPPQFRLQSGGIADTTTGLTSTFNLAPGQGMSLWNQKVESQAELAGHVDLNGIPQDAVGIGLVDASGKTVAHTTTDATGKFVFWVAAGVYSVSYDVTPGMTSSAAVSLADGQTFLLMPLQLTPAQIDTSTTGAVLSPTSQSSAGQQTGGASPVPTSPSVDVGSGSVQGSISGASSQGSDVGSAAITPSVNVPTTDAVLLPTSQSSAGQQTGGASNTLSSTRDILPLPGAPQSTYRFFDTLTGTQFLTSSVSERDSILQNSPNFIYEGNGMGSVTMDPSNLNVAPVFRFFNAVDGTHFFTTSVAERDTILATRPDLIQEQANFAEHLQAQAGDTAVYRFFDSRSGDHFFTQSANERATIMATRPDMVNEGTAFYAPSQA